MPDVHAKSVHTSSLENTNFGIEQKAQQILRKPIIKITMVRKSRGVR